MLITLIVVLFAVFLLLSWIYFWQSRAWKEELEFYEAEAARRQAEPEQMPLNFRQPVSTPRLHDDLAFILMDDDEPQQPSLLPEDEDAAAVAETPAPAKRSKPAAPPIELPADPEPLPAAKPAAGAQIITLDDILSSEVPAASAGHHGTDGFFRQPENFAAPPRHTFSAALSEREIISDEEALRLVRQEQEAAGSKRPAQTIEADDPAVQRVRRRALEQLEEIQNKLPPLPQIRRSYTREPEEIDLDDIRERLNRRQSARREIEEPAPPSPQPDQALSVIPEDEIWQNLNNSNAAAFRRNRRPAPSYGSYAPPRAEAVPQPASFQAAAQPYAPRAPEIVDSPFNFPPPAVERLPDAGYAAVQPESEYPPAAPFAAESPQHYSVGAHDTGWTEADFEQYYREQKQPENRFAESFYGNSAGTSGDTVNTAWLEGLENLPAADNEAPEWQRWLESGEGFDHGEGGNSQLPPMSLLLPPKHNPAAVQSEEELLQNSITIEEKLAEFRVKVKVLDAYAGPVITRYEIEPDVGVRGNSVMNLEKDLARSLGVAAIRVVETIPGKTCMGLELPNPRRQTIRLREILESSVFQDNPSKLALALGQDTSGAPVVTDLAKAPHLLVAGTTGSGKSVGVNAMILSMLFKARPEDVRLIMIDPKMLELSIYEGIPHLLAPVVTDMKLAANALNWCVNEMEKRYRLMSHLGVRNLAGYNEKVTSAKAAGRRYANPFSLTPDNPEYLEKLPAIVVVVDEFADLMMTAGKKIEELIARLAQKARAAGIHLILATQRPSVDVITGLIKANIPTRIAFQVSSKVDSRTIIDQMGAENLLGQGDMLFLPPGTGYPQRVHGAFVADNEVHGVVEYLKQTGEPDYVEDLLNGGSDDLFGANPAGGSGERDPLFDEAVAVLLRTQKASISSLQRHLRVGYNKAATLFDQLEAEGIVSAPDHTGKRTILARSPDSE